MRTHALRLGVVLFAGALVAGLGLAAADPVAAQQAVSCDETLEVDIPETQDAMLSELRALEGSPGMEAYSEFELIRSQAVLGIQAGEFTPTDRERTAGVIRVLYSFEQAHSCLETGEYRAALEAANETEQLVADLPGEQGAHFRAVADVGLLRFYEVAGGELLGLGEQQEVTPDRIETFSLAATAFRQAGAVDRFSQLSARLEEIEREFTDDMARVDDSIAAAEEFADECEDCDSVGAILTTHGTAVFSMYRAGLDAREEVETADALVAQHGVEEPAVRDAETAVDERTTSLALASAAVLAGWGAVVGLLAGIATSRIVAWKRDLETATAGDVLLIGRLLDA